ERLWSAPRSPDKAEGRIRVAYGSVATRAQGPARTLPQGARTGTATIGRHAGPGCASLTRATRLTGATRLHVARIRPKAASGVAHGSVATRAQGPARTWPQGAHTGTATIGRRAGPRVRFAYPGYASCCGIGDGGQRRPPCSRPGPRPYDAGLRRHARQWRACARLTPQGKRAQGRQGISAR